MTLVAGEREIMEVPLYNYRGDREAFAQIAGPARS
jgi:hypothetical protein